METEAEPSPEEQVEAVEEASTDADESEHLDVAEEAEAEGEQPEAVAVEAEPEPSTPERPVVQPFSFAADGKRVEVEGASVVEHPGPDGKPTRSVVIPLDAFQRRVQPYLADRGKFANKERDYQRQLAALSPDKNETVIRAQTMLDEFEKVLGSEDSLTAFLQNFEQNRELLKLKVENAATAAKLRAREEGEQHTQTEQDEQATVQQVQEDLPNGVRAAASVLKQHFSVDVPEAALNAAYAEINENLGVYYRRATQQDAEQYGVNVGQIIRDEGRIERTLYRFASLLTTGSAQQQMTTEAAKRNQAALGDKKKPPPTVSAKGSAPPAERKVEIKSWDDFKERMGGQL